MTTEQLSAFLRFLKKKKIKQGDIATTLTIESTYISKMKTGKRKLTESFVELLKAGYIKEWEQFQEVQKVQKIHVKQANSAQKGFHPELSLEEIAIKMEELVSAVRRIANKTSQEHPLGSGKQQIKQVQNIQRKDSRPKKGRSGKDR